MFYSFYFYNCFVKEKSDGVYYEKKYFIRIVRNFCVCNCCVNPTVIGSDNSTSIVTYCTVSFDTNERYKECKRK